MKRLICILAICALMLPAHSALAEANWWSDIGSAKQTSAPEPTPEPAPQPKLDLAGLLGGLMGSATPAPDVEQDPVEEDIHPDIDYGDETTEEGDDLAAEAALNALFDSGVCEITGRPYGNAAECARINDGWTITRGYHLDDYRVTAEHIDSYGRHVMADATLMQNFVPAGNGIIYYGESTKGKWGWLFKRPGETAPTALPLKDSDSVFYTDEDYIWYFTYGSGSSRPISRMGYDGKKKKQLGKLNGTVIAMMDDGAVLAAFYSRNQVILWKDGKSSVVYETEEEITSVISTGRSIWVQHEDRFGLLEDGKLTFTHPGVIRSMGRTSDQLVFVVDRGRGGRFDVLMFNDVYRAWAFVGDIQAQLNINVELMPWNSMTVWGPDESMWYSTPDQAAWLPYGQFTR